MSILYCHALLIFLTFTASREGEVGVGGGMDKCHACIECLCECCLPVMIDSSVQAKIISILNGNGRPSKQTRLSTLCSRVSFFSFAFSFLFIFNLSKAFNFD